jgi:hypothetical protein
MEMSGQFHAPANLSLWKELSLVGPVRHGEDEMFAPAGNRTPAAQPVATHGIDRAVQKIVSGKNIVLSII